MMNYKSKATVALIAYAVIGLSIPITCNGCATLRLNSIINESELVDSNKRMEVSGNGISKIMARQIYYSKSLDGNNYVFESTVNDTKVYIECNSSNSPNYSRITFSDKTNYQENIEHNTNVITFLISENFPQNINLTDLQSGDAIAIIQIFDQNKRAHNYSSNSSIEYKTIEGMAFFVDSGVLKHADIEQRFSKSTSAKFISAAQMSGYLLTVPLDVATSPIQGLYMLAFSKRAPGP
jgi:hypothetical protein